jgi:non-ribosomal peptide synthase protein (TIGR01720 family)
MESAYRQLAEQRELRLPMKTSSPRQWAFALEAYSQSIAVDEEVSYWLGQSNSGEDTLASQAQSFEIPRATSALCSVSLDQQETLALVHEVPGHYGVQVSEVLLTALLRAVLPWSGGDALCLDVEGHGREDSIGSVDLMRSIACFTCIYPISLRLGDSGDSGEDLKRVKEQLRTIPRKGIGYGLLRYPMSEETGISALTDLAPAQVLFNYMGQWGRTLAADSRFRFVGPIRAYHGTRGQRSHPWEINAMVFDEQLHIDWTYNPELHDKALIERLAQQFICALGELISYCIATDDSSLTPSDFPAAELSQGELNDLLAEFSESGSRSDG